MEIQRLSAFADAGRGGNPAGVVIGDALPPPAEMQRIAAEIGYSETAFAAPDGAGGWTVRYYAPAAGVAFCGHATIALGVALGRRAGPGRFPLALRDAAISVEATRDGADWRAALTSPPTRSAPLDPGLRDRLLALFDLTAGDLDPRLPPRLAEAGERHAILALRDRARLAAMAYPFYAGQALMRDARLTTISLLQIETPRLIHSRNAFAIGGVVEDPANGAAAAALGGALVDLDWDGLREGGAFTVLQGADMGAPSRLEVTVTGTQGDPVTVAGAVRDIAEGDVE
ncbi:PhzF family phenazine biosynthesis protein [Jannaschia ovalis]|uniref:PhzF family phenazine biosynthesis isomerase n=1 Tax=Jannaschia ovalis TaxID=3038773 RepID=A0ABY8LA93_9RHOB|nr:PhzF family phenazine biosynthesis isomerase [Jannaschia sp. GRR-S6-38]WGH78214.1 PhzF family phenazine biosynthesis isomerase [Jannaschia sp. GRR-S6-38]